MPLKIKNKNGEWVVDQKAIHTTIMDVEGNFESDNVEGALRELAQRPKSRTNPELELQVQKNKLDISNIKNTLLDHEERISYLEENGGGGGGSPIVPTITSTFTDCAIEKGQDVTIPIFFSSPSGGNGTAYVLVNNMEVDYISVKQGNNNLKIEGKYLTQTDNLIAIYVKDRAGIVSNQLSWNVIAGGITLTTTFDYEVDYGITDNIIMPYNIETGINGEIKLHLTVDGESYEIISKNGYNQLDMSPYVGTLGTHSVSMYATVDKYTSPTIKFNLVITSTTELYLSTTFVNGSEYTYGVPISINYRLSKKSTELFDVYIFLDDVLEKTQELTVGSYYWTLNKATVGEHKVTVRAISKDGAENKSIDMYFSIIKGEYIPIEDITEDLYLDLNAAGKSNNDNHNNLWKDSSGNNRHGEMINFNFSTNGFINDTVVCDNNAYIKIPYSPWSTNAKNGSTIDLIYTPINSGNEDARVIDYTFITDDMADGDIKPFKGLFADIRQAIVSSASSGSNSGNVTLDENSGEIHLTWVLDRANKFCKTYINGVLSRIMFLSDSGSGNNATYEDFAHNEYIYLNSTKGENCGTYDIKRLRIWGHALTSDEVLKTHLANIKDLEKQEELYNFNYNNTTLPRMDLYGDITNMTPYQTVDMRIQYTSPNEEKYGPSFNTGIQNNPVKIQGTSSLQYVRHNYTIYLKDEYGNPMMYNPYGEGKAMPDHVFCLKADYIESSHANNTGMANFINDNVYDTKLPPQLENPAMRSTIAGFPIVVYMNGEYLGVYNFNHDRYSTESYGYDYKKYPNMLVYEINSNSNTSAGAFYRYGDNPESSANINERDYYARDFKLIYGNRTSDSDTYSEIKSLVEWVSVAEQDLFRETISEHFNKEYLFRYLLTVLMIGGVDSLGKNMKITTFDGKVWYPTFYDLDTCLGIDNSGYLTIQPDVEIEEGSFNTSNSNLWTKVMNYFASELKEEWALMRQGRFTLDNLLKYVIENQIEVIPAKYYNDDAQVKYLDFGSLYTYCCHGNKELLVKRWLRERIAYVDSMMDYFTSQDDQVTIRMNKTGYVEFSVTPYIPLYFSVKWSNAEGGTQTFKLKRGETKTFYYTSTTATDQEVIIYHAQYIKELGGLSNLRPSSCILANATKLNNVEIHSDKLYNVNVSNNKYLRRLDLSGCSTLGTVTATGSVLDVSNCKYLSYLNINDTALTGVLLNTSGGSLKEIYYPKTIQEVKLIKQTLLETIGLPYGKNGSEIPTSLYTVNIQECPSVKKLNTSSNPEISKTWISMKYCQNLTIRNALDFETITLDGFQRLKVLRLENMFKLKSLGFDDMLPVGEASTLQYMGISYCPELIDITMNCTSNDYEITFAKGALLNLSGATKLNSISSNCVIHGLETIVLPLSIKHLYFTNEYGTGYSSIKNIWSSRSCEINEEGVLPVAIRYEDQDYIGMDLQGMKLNDIDLGALVNIPRAINFDLSPTTVNPNFNINRDGVEYPYLQPEGVLNLSNYTESLARFFNGVDLDKLEVVVENPLPQTDLSYCFYNSSFSNENLLSPILSNVSNINNLDYCFYKTTIKSPNIVNNISFENGTMNYTFGECKNITALNGFTVSSGVTSSIGLFSDCPITTITNTKINTNGSCSAIFKGCTSLTNASGLAMPNTSDISSAFEECTKLTGVPFIEITDKITDISKLYYGCINIDNIDGMVFGSSISNSEDWINKEQILSANNVVIRNDAISFEGWNNLRTCNNLLITSNVKTFENYFKDCINLTSITFNEASVFSNIKSMAYMLSGCSSLINNPILEILDSCTNISYIFADSGITDISGLVIGSGVTSAVSWYPPNLTTANNVVIKNNFVKFTSCETLQYAKNVTLDYDCEAIDSNKVFNECTSLLDVSGLIIGDGIKSSSYMFGYCNKLKKVGTINFNNVINGDYTFAGCINLSSANVEFPNATSLAGTFMDTSLTSCSINISDTTTNISYLFSGCSSLTDISGTRFGAGITTITEWIPKSQILYANNISLNSKNIKFKDFNKLIQCNNLMINPSFTNLNELFYGCSSITNIDLSNNSLPNCRGVARLCESCTSLISLKLPEFNDKVDIYRLCAGCGKVEVIEFYPKIMDVSRQYGFEDVNYQVFSNCSRLTTLKNFKVKCTLIDSDRQKYLLRQSIGGLRSMWSGTNNLRNTEGMGVYNNDGRAIFYGYLGDISEFEIGSEVTDISYIFQGRTGITKDFEFTNWITNCTEAFKGCTKLTHVHSNWNNTYTNGIVPTDCYAECTGITHIDGQNVIAYEGDNGLDYVPLDWGGNGFTLDNTMIYELNITESFLNTSLKPIGVKTLLSLDESVARVNWGDGSPAELLCANGKITEHNYTTKGTYFVKAHASMGHGYGAGFAGAISKILQVPKYEKGKINNLLQYACSGAVNMTYADLSNMGYEKGVTKFNLGALFNNCEKLETVIIPSDLIVTDCSTVFNNCKSLTSVEFIRDWDVSNSKTMNNLFTGCKSLTSVDCIKDWDVSNVNNMSWMFGGTSIEDFSFLNNWNPKSLKNVIGMFKENTALTSITLPDWFNSDNIKDKTCLFQRCSSLQEVHNLDWRTNMTLSGSLPTYPRTTFEGCTSLTTIESVNMDYTSILGTQHGGNGITNDYWSSFAWQIFNGLNKLTDINFKGTITLYPARKIIDTFVNCDCTKFTLETWQSFTDTLPTTAETYTIKFGTKSLASIPDSIVVQIQNKGYTLST